MKLKLFGTYRKRFNVKEMDAEITDPVTLRKLFLLIDSRNSLRIGKQIIVIICKVKV